MADIAAIVAFLTARYDEAEAVAAAAKESDGGSWGDDSEGNIYDRANGAYVATGPYGSGIGDEARTHIVLHDPDRVLRDITLKRRILTDTWGSPDHEEMWEYHIQLLGTEFSDHPGYDERWRP